MGRHITKCHWSILTFSFMKCLFVKVYLFFLSNKSPQLSVIQYRFIGIRLDTHDHIYLRFKNIQAISAMRICTGVP